MMGHRGRGVALYALFAVLVAGGGAWFVRAAPRTGADPRLAGWQTTAARLLPDQSFQIKADTIVISGDRSTERTTAVDAGAYSLSMVCLGDGGQVRVRLSEGGDDSGRGLPCTEDPRTVTLTVALATHFFMTVSGETGGPAAVFRWRLDRVRGL
jgi:hypothetical protein